MKRQYTSFEFDEGRAWRPPNPKFIDLRSRGRGMKHRKLRIAWSVAWGVGGVLLIALWVHALHRQMRFECWVTKSSHIRFIALKHWIEIEATSREIGPPGTWYPPASFQDIPVNPQQEATASPDRRWHCTRYHDSQLARLTLVVPLWFPVLSIACIGALPWIIPFPSRTRSSILTMVIATILVAVGLGLIVWLRK
jgi:hypothetical protein